MEIPVVPKVTLLFVTAYRLPEDFKVIASTDSAPIAGMADEDKKLYALQFHPEVTHTRQGMAILQRFLHEIAGCGSSWTMENIIDDAIRETREKVGRDKVLLGLSGGVDSSVVAFDKKTGKEVNNLS